MKYRREIDGLRAVAVVPVILFHAGFNVFSGGYVGVDIFFVISGYLITTILINELEQGNFSIAGFYERRARRILPALFFVMLACLPVAYMWMLPSQLKDFGQSLVAVVTFSSNILFWLESGYFSTVAELKPLLHTWSLAVEEQYYLLFPVFLLLTWRFGRKRVFWSVIAIAAISLLMAEWGWRNNPTANFYLALPRAWELLAGSICAFLTVGRAQRSNNFLSALGLTMIFFSIFAYDSNTPFPSIYALVPVAGTAIIILFAAQDTWVARLLSTRAFVGIGLISYSAYLWHQPLFAFARIRSLMEPSEYLMAGLALAALLLAWATWRYIERPFRKKEKSIIVTRQGIFFASATLSALIVAVGFVGHFGNGFEWRLDREMRDFLESASPSKLRLQCEDDDGFCKIRSSKSTVGENVLVIGDSHSAALLPAFIQASSENIWNLYHSGLGGCPPLLGLYVIDSNNAIGRCAALTQDQLSSAVSNNIDTVILIARWSLHVDSDGYKTKEKLRFFLCKAKICEKSIKHSREVFEEQLSKTISRWRALGVRIVVVPQVPQQEFSPESVLPRIAMNKSWNTKIVQEIGVSLIDHLSLQNYSNSILETTSQAGAEILNLNSYFCTRDYCRMFLSGRSLYEDDDHLSNYGAKSLSDRVATFFN